jgi:hypothetical protein
VHRQFSGVQYAGKNTSPRRSHYHFSQETIVAGDGKTFPKKGDKLTMHYVYVLLGETS